MSNDRLGRNHYRLRFNDSLFNSWIIINISKRRFLLWTKKQTLDHFHTLTSQELEQVVGGGWLEDLFSPYLKKYKLGKLGQPDLG